MKVRLIILSIFATFKLMGQCPEFSNTITLTSQSQVDAFVADYPNCEELNNNLIIGHFGAPVSTDINDLSGLSPLKRVDGELRVRNVDLLESLEGLHNIEYVGDDLVIGDNELLKNLSDFKHIDSLGKNFEIYNNPNLEILFEEDSILYIGGSLNIKNNDKLTQVSGFSKLRSINGNFEIAGNTEIKTTTGFGSLEFIDGTFDISDSPQLQNLNGFEVLTIINNGMEIRGTGITDFTGLNSLHQINGTLLGNSVAITNNLNLVSFSGLESLDSIQRSLFLIDNEHLESISGLSNLKYIGGRLSIENSSLSEIASLNGISPITATVEISDNPNLISLDQLPLSSNIDGSLVIRDNSSLIDITSISSVDSLFGQLNVQDNISLFDCVSLCALLTTGFVESIITIRDNLGNCETEEDLTVLCTTSTQNIIDKESIKIFPNPTESVINIEALSNIQEAAILRVDGSIVNLLQFDDSTHIVNIDVSDLQIGLYFLELVIDDIRIIKKFVKQ